MPWNHDAICRSGNPPAPTFGFPPSSSLQWNHDATLYPSIFTTTLRERLVSYSVSQSPAFFAFTASGLDISSRLLAWGDLWTKPDPTIPKSQRWPANQKSNILLAAFNVRYIADLNCAKAKCANKGPPKSADLWEVVGPIQTCTTCKMFLDHKWWYKQHWRIEYFIHSHNWILLGFCLLFFVCHGRPFEYIQLGEAVF